MFRDEIEKKTNPLRNDLKIAIKKIKTKFDMKIKEK
jgi:hypothetical protein